MTRVYRLTCSWTVLYLHARKADGKDSEVLLEAGVDGKTVGSGVHAGHVLHVVDLLLSEFGTIVPVVVVKVLEVNKI